MESVELSAGVVEYGDTGGGGPALVLLHGLAMDGRVWDPVVSELGGGYRFLTPARGRRDMLAATPALRRFEEPVLVVWSPGDRMLRPANGRRLAEAFPHSTPVEVPGSYVLMPIDQPAALAGTLREFVAQ